MFWSNEHDVFSCREVVTSNPFTSKKGSTQGSGMWEKISQILNKCTILRFSRFAVNLQCLSQDGNGHISMWETQLKITYNDYDLTRDQSELLSEKVTVLLENKKPEVCSEVEGTQQQSLCDKWFSESGSG